MFWLLLVVAKDFISPRPCKIGLILIRFFLIKDKGDFFYLPARGFQSNQQLDFQSLSKDEAGTWKQHFGFVHWCLHPRWRGMCQINLPITKIDLGMVFCYQNCSDLLWEKIVLVVEKNFWSLRLKAENLQKFSDHWNNFIKQWKVRIIFGNKMLF